MSTRIASPPFWNSTATRESSNMMLLRGYPRSNLLWISASRLSWLSLASQRPRVMRRESSTVPSGMMPLGARSSGTSTSLSLWAAQ